MNLKEFADFNTNESSEMFVSVISVLQDRLPCTAYILSDKKLFRQTEFARHQKTLPRKNEDDDELVAKAEEMCNSPLRVVA